MRYNVAGLLKAPTGEQRVVEIEATLDLGDDPVNLVSPVRGGVRLTRVDVGVLAEARLTVRMATACARCLTPMELEVVVELAETFRPTVEIPGGPPVEPSAERDPATEIDELHTLDLTEVVRQAVLLAEPMHPLCRDDCRGLCPTCGADLNGSGCDCEPEPDPRWDALRSLLDED
jgi:uncharacterized protein